MYDETGPDGKRRYTVTQIAEEFGVISHGPSRVAPRAFWTSPRR